MHGCGDDIAMILGDAVVFVAGLRCRRSDSSYLGEEENGYSKVFEG